MSLIKSSVLLFALIIATSVSQETVELKERLQEFFHTGHVTDEFLQLVKQYKFPHLFRDDMEKVYDNPTVCHMCNLVVDLVITERYLGLSRQSLMEEAVVLCKELEIESERVCKGIIDINVDALLYIMDNYQNFTSNRVCGSVLQSFGCSTGETFQWSIDIPSGNSPQRPTPNDTNVESFSILHISDIHYDPDYTPNGNANCGEPICCQSDQGEPETPEDACGYWGDYRSGDASWQLVEETIQQAKGEEYAYVYYTGDVIAHRVWDTSIESNTEAMTKLYGYFKEQFDTPVFPVFGNHEPHPLNLWPGSSVNQSSVKWLFELAAEQWSDLIGQDITETVLKGGYYSVSPTPGFRIIGLNSNVGYTDNWWLMFEDFDPFGQLQWLVDELKAAEDNNESVHILSHVPTGSSSSLIVWNREFTRIIERFANTITGLFNGHTHKDEFLVYYNSSDLSQAIRVAFNGASVTPFVGNNPSYKIYDVDKATFNLLDYAVWYTDLGFANKVGPVMALPWEVLYTFNYAYGSANLIPSEVNKVVLRMTEDHSLLDKYYNYKSRDSEVANQGGCDDDCKKDNLCNIVRAVYRNDEQCERILAMYDQSS